MAKSKNAQLDTLFATSVSKGSLRSTATEIGLRRCDGHESTTPCLGRLDACFGVDRSAPADLIAVCLLYTSDAADD